MIYLQFSVRKPLFFVAEARKTLQEKRQNSGPQKETIMAKPTDQFIRSLQVPEGAKDVQVTTSCLGLAFGSLRAARLPISSSTESASGSAARSSGGSWAAYVTGLVSDPLSTQQTNHEKSEEIGGQLASGTRLS
jgi:hypothetical protein